MIEGAAFDGDGRDERPSWYKKQPPNWRPDFANLPITPIEKGGAEHRYQQSSRADPEMSEPTGLSDASRRAGSGAKRPAAAPRHPLDRSVASWSRDDMRAVMNAPAYRNPQHPRHAEAQRMVRQWFEQSVGPSSAPVDASGRIIAAGAGTPAGAAQGGCPVPVRAHARDGGKVQVESHCRAKPA